MEMQKILNFDYSHFAIKFGKFNLQPFYGLGIQRICLYVPILTERSGFTEKNTNMCVQQFSADGRVKPDTEHGMLAHGERICNGSQYLTE